MYRKMYFRINRVSFFYNRKIDGNSEIINAFSMTLALPVHQEGNVWTEQTLPEKTALCQTSAVNQAGTVNSFFYFSLANAFLSFSVHMLKVQFL